MSDLDLTEAALAAAKNLLAESNRVTGEDRTWDMLQPKEREHYELQGLAAVQAAAPIIERQVAERIADRIENHISQHEIQPSEKDCDVCYGLEIAADIAREVGSDG